MTKKMYLPKDDIPNLFKIRTSDNAIIVFLDYFGYPNIHLTFYVKEFPNNERLFDIHITNEKNGEKIYQNSIKINLLETEKEIQKKLLELKNNFINLIKEHKKKSIFKNDLLCLNCFFDGRQKFPEKLNDKKFASKFYSGFFNKTIKLDLEKLKECSNCKNLEHNMFMDNKLTNMYIKNSLGLFTYNDQVEFSNRLSQLIKEKFIDEFDKLNKILDEIKMRLEEYKNKISDHP